MKLEDSTGSPQAAICSAPAWDENARLAALDRYAILDTGREESFDEVAELAADILEAPVAVVNFIAADRQWFKAEKGIGQDSLPLDVSICRHAILQPGIFVVPDLKEDTRFVDNPLVSAAGGLRFYAGALIETDDGLPLGTVCVLDTVARPQGITEYQQRALRVLARQTMTQLELRRSEALAQEQRLRAEKHSGRLSLLAGISARMLAAPNPAILVRDLFAILREPLRLDVFFHYRCGDEVLELVAAAGLTPEQERAAARLPFGRTVCGIVAQSRQPVHLAGITVSGDPHSAFLRTLGIDAYSSVPLMAQDELLGTLSFGRREGAFTPGELEMLNTLSAHVATVLERLRLETSLRERDELLSSVLTSVDGVVFAKDLSGRYLVMNEAGTRLHGKSPGEAIGRTDEELFGSAVAADLRSNDAATLAAAGPLTIEEQATVDGETRIYQTTKTPFRNGSGEVAGIVGVSIDVTARKAKEAALAASEARLALAVEGSGLGLWEYDVAEAGGTWSDRMFEIYGLEPKSWLTGSDWLDRIHPDDRDRVEREFAAHVALIGPFTNSFRITTPTREVRHVQVRGTSDGERAVGVCADITDERAAEERRAFLLGLSDRLREDPRATLVTTQALGRALAVSRAGYAIADEAAEHLTVEHEWAEDGARPALGRHRLDDFGPWIAGELRAGRKVVVEDVLTDPRTADQAAAHAAIATRSVVTVPIMRADTLVATVYLNHHQPRQWTADEIRLVEEVAERTWAAVQREWAEAALAETSRRLGAILGNTREAVFLMDDRQHCVYANPAAEELTGYSFAELRARPLHDVIHNKKPDGSHYPLEECPIDRAFPEQAQTQGEELFVGPDGSFYPVAFTASPVLDDEGQPIGTVIEARNIAQETAQREELHRLNHELAARVAEAVAEREAALAQVHEMQKLETIGHLTGGVAHDFNNLLTPIVGSLDLLQRRHGEDERSARMIAGALQSAERAKTLVSRLLSFARRQILESRPVDLVALVGGMRDLIDRSLGPRIEVTMDLPPDLPAAEVDPNQLELALLNLCVNARDAMPDGGSLLIAADTADVAAGEPELRPGRYVRLCVADSGGGMSAETLARAVEPFYTTKGTGKGTGLGLSMVHGLAAQSGGALHLHSEPGRGTTATIWLPAVESRPETAEADTGADKPAASRPLSILLVDDEELVREGTADMLEAMGHRVIQAASAADALERVMAGKPFDLLLTDHMMPGMTGVELVRSARAVRAGLPAVLVTGFAALSDAEAAGLPRLAKPFRAADLTRALAEAMKGTA